jgi:hypothetical protein
MDLEENDLEPKALGFRQKFTERIKSIPPNWIKLLPVILILAALPVTVALVKIQTSTSTHAQIQTDLIENTDENGEDDASGALPLAVKVTTQTATSSANPIVLENQNAGTNAWAVGSSRVSSDTNKEIKGYAGKTSVNKGETIDFKVTVYPTPQTFTIDIYRLGWYQGLGGRLMKSVGPISGVKKAACPQNSTTKMVECTWKTDYTLVIPSNWTTGSYLAKLINKNGYVNYINFTVRDDSSHSDILLQNSTNTWQAYNKWGGAALYPPGQTHGVKVSYDRPYTGLGTSVQDRELQMIRFLEKNGYDLSYTTDVDTHERGNLILNHKAFISMGHDEYWSWEMRNAVEGARDKGIDLAFFGGNESYWQVRYEPSSSGVADRVLVGYKEQYKNDPYYKSTDPNKKKRTSSLFRYSFINRPEQLMLGEEYGTNLGQTDRHIMYTVTNPTNWIWAGANVREGQQLTDIVGKEYNRVYPSAKSANLSFNIVSKSVNPTTGTIANSVIYQSPSGAWVFSAGTMDWSLGLDDYGRGYGHVNTAIQQVTRNILNRFIGVSSTPTPTPTNTPTPTVTPTATLTPTFTPTPTP